MEPRIDRFIGFWFFLLLGCGSELPPLPEASSVSFEVEPETPLDAVAPVVRLRVGSPRANPATLRLFRDPLSDYHVARIRSGELPGTLLEREVPSLAWTEGGSATLAPASVLDDGTYSLASPELGLVGTFTVRADAARPLYQRLWPTEGSTGLGAAYCGVKTELVESEITLAPSGAAARLVPGLGSEGLFFDRCLRLELVDAVPDALALVPPALGPVLLDPTPLVASAAPEQGFQACAESDIELGAGCARIEDDRLVLKSDQALLWLFAEPAPAVTESAGGAEASVSGLLPDSEFRVRGETLDAWGRARPFEASLRTLAARPRLVLNEVLSNPNGPEPATEWIELLNAGSAGVTLEGYLLEDAGGSAVLPDVVLGPGAYALLVKEGFVADPAVDVPPLPGTLLIALPSLAKNGISNTGEIIRLFDEKGALVSRVPALAAKHAGVSLARRTPDSPDEESSFGDHAAPGASPGGPNSVED